MGFIFILIVIAVVVLWLMRDPSWLREIYKGKNAEQKKVIRYFLREGCLSRVMKDEEYDGIVNRMATEQNFKQRAIDKFVDIEFYFVSHD